MGGWGVVGWNVIVIVRSDVFEGKRLLCWMVLLNYFFVYGVDVIWFYDGIFSKIIIVEWVLVLLVIIIVFGFLFDWVGGMKFENGDF